MALVYIHIYTYEEQAQHGGEAREAAGAVARQRQVRTLRPRVARGATHHGRTMRCTMRRTIQSSDPSPSPSPDPPSPPPASSPSPSTLRSRTHSWPRECRPSADGRTKATPTSSLCTGCRSGARCTESTRRLLGGRVDGGGRGWTARSIDGVSCGQADGGRGGEAW